MEAVSQSFFFILLMKVKCLYKNVYLILKAKKKFTWRGFLSAYSRQAYDYIYDSHS